MRIKFSSEREEQTALSEVSRGSLPVKNSNKLRNGLIGGGVIAALAVGAGVAGIIYVNSGEKLAEVPTTDAPVDPTETAASTEPETQPSTPENSFDTEVGFRTDVYTTPESLIQAAVDMNTQWLNDGATEENLNAAFSMNNPLTTEEFSAELAAQTDQKYIESVFASDWESDIDIASFVEKTVNNHKNTLNLFFTTNNLSGSNPEDVEPYRREANLIAVERSTENSDGSWTIVTIRNEIDNDDKNRADQLTAGVRSDEFEIPARVVFTWTVEGDRWVLSDLQNLGPA